MNGLPALAVDWQETLVVLARLGILDKAGVPLQQLGVTEAPAKGSAPVIQGLKCLVAATP